LISPKPLTAFEFGPSSTSSTPVVLFIAGLNDTLGSVPYLPSLAERLDGLGWCLAQVCLTSAGAGWGGASVEQDARELGEVVRYFRERGWRKVVLLGHSTGASTWKIATQRDVMTLSSSGCQDAIAYAHLRSRDSFQVPPLDAIILQAPVSDREWPAVANLVASNEHVFAGEADLDLDAFVPSAWSNLFGTSTGVTYRRWRSLALPAPSDQINLAESEDFFSSDLSDARLANVFRAVDCPLLIVLSGEDETYPEGVKADLPTLLDRFRDAARDRCSVSSRIVEGASHNLADEKHAGEFADAVFEFLRGV
jgi:pimeloyl-ACP methyl ester carboxylesterase